MSEVKHTQISPGFKETLDRLYELSGEKRPSILSKLFAPSVGPWQVMNAYDGATTVIANVDGETFSDGTSTFSYDFVCDTLPDDGDGSRSLEIAKANARLIAAAPELLDDMIEAERMFRWYGDLHAAKPDAEKAARNYEMADRLAATIAKAEGRT